jgi:DNA segregation ATPase FtsK/SpoIIIE-like protein
MKFILRQLANLRQYVLGLSSDEYKSDHKDENQRLDSNSYQSSPDVHVRTKSIYPQQRHSPVQFRFPIIPDHLNSEESPIKQDKTPSKSNGGLQPNHPLHSQGSNENHKKLNRPENVKSPTPVKQPFKLTEIVSPIHGKQLVANKDTTKKDFSNPVQKVQVVDKAKLSAAFKGFEQLNNTKNPYPALKPETSQTVTMGSLPLSEPEINKNVKTILTTVTEELSSANLPIGESPLLQEDLEEKETSAASEEGTVLNRSGVPIVDIESQAAIPSMDNPAHNSIRSGEYRKISQLSQLKQDAEEQQQSKNKSEDVNETEPVVLPKSLYSIPRDDDSYKENLLLHAPIVSKLQSEKHAEPIIKKDSVSNRTTGNSSYCLPEYSLLNEEPVIENIDYLHTDDQMDKLAVTLESFNVKAEVIGAVKGPTVTRYELQPAPGVKVNKFTTLIDDIKLALAAKDIRMEAPIPGRSAIGIEVPNDVNLPVYIRPIIESDEFLSHSSPLAIALGRDIAGQPIVGDLKKMPHGLIAGSTGSGKSVCINSIIISLLYKSTPADVRLILIDPKVVELAPYNHIPHLLTPVVTDPKQATAALKWAVGEMDRRYELFADSGAREIERYNEQGRQQDRDKLPYIVIIIDELADLMMVAPGDVEESICRIAQKARACGIHLVVATQRPSVDVITGLIKANIPTRVAFAVSSQADSRTILDTGGAERLLGKGDMLYYPSGIAKPIRVQGNFVSDDEIERVVEHVRREQQVHFLFDKEELSKVSIGGPDNDDELFEEALLFVIEQGHASSSSLQRKFRIGYNRAARLVDMMESESFISGQSGSKPREVLISMDDYLDMFG